MSLSREPLSQWQFRLRSLGRGMNFPPALEQKVGHGRAALTLPPSAQCVSGPAWLGGSTWCLISGGWVDGWMDEARQAGTGERPEGKGGGHTNNSGRWAEAAGCV